MTRWWLFLAGNTRMPINTIQATKVVSRSSSSQLANRVTYRQNRENSASTQFTANLGFPSQRRTLDSWSYFFMTVSRSIGSSGIVFFLKNPISLPP